MRDEVPGRGHADTRHAVAALHQAIATEVLYGREFRRSAGMTAAEANDSAMHVRWWVRQLELSLGIEPAHGGA
ncbi:hypothetical protein [Nocardia cyriacigeorgica]|uniref:hypothetical protein n=1 Tax=Nocardia cyriacigeorgica TaxID=135487 RepID=UPI00158EDC63|nr:hypothetical protein [Nocardia cyriacigeorgica]